MNTTLTVVLGIVAIIFPFIVGRIVWKRYNQHFGKNDEVYMDTLSYFLKKLGLTALATFIALWIGMSLVFNGNIS